MTSWGEVMSLQLLGHLQLVTHRENKQFCFHPSTFLCNASPARRVVFHFTNISPWTYFISDLSITCLKDALQVTMILQILCLNLRPSSPDGKGWRSLTRLGRTFLSSWLEFKYLVLLMIKGWIGDNAGAKPTKGKEGAKRKLLHSIFTYCQSSFYSPHLELWVMSKRVTLGWWTLPKGQSEKLGHLGGALSREEAVEAWLGFLQDASLGGVSGIYSLGRRTRTWLSERSMSYQIL